MATKKSKKSTKKSASSRRGRSGGVNKSAFIREQPETMSAREIVALAAAQGMELSEGFVYNVRSNAKAKAKKAGGAQPKASAVTAAPSAAVGGDEAAFRRLVVALGTGRAKQLVVEVEAKIIAAIEGR